MLGLRQPMVDVVAGACELEGVRAESPSLAEHLLDLRRAPSLAGRVGEMNAIVGERRMDLVGNRLDQSVEKARGGFCRGSLMQLDEGELRRSIDRHEHIEFAFGRAHLGDIDMEIADRIGFEFPLGGDLAVDFRQL